MHRWSRILPWISTRQRTAAARHLPHLHRTICFPMNLNNSVNRMRRETRWHSLSHSVLAFFFKIHHHHHSDQNELSSSTDRDQRRIQIPPLSCVDFLLFSFAEGCCCRCPWEELYRCCSILWTATASARLKRKFRQQDHTIDIRENTNSSRAWSVDVEFCHAWP